MSLALAARIAALEARVEALERAVAAAAAPQTRVEPDPAPDTGKPAAPATRARSRK